MCRSFAALIRGHRHAGQLLNTVRLRGRQPPHTDQDDRHIVDSAVVIGPVNQRARRRFDIPGLAQNGDDLLVRHHARETVAAQQDHVSFRHPERRPLQFHTFVNPNRPHHDPPEHRVQVLLVLDTCQGGGGMIPRDLGQRFFPEQVEPAVPGMQCRRRAGLGGVETDAHKRASGPPGAALFRTVVDPRRHVVQSLRDPRLRGRPGIRPATLVQPVTQRSQAFNNRLGSHLSVLRATHAIRHAEHPVFGIASKGVFIVLALTPQIGERRACEVRENVSHNPSPEKLIAL